MYQTWLEMIEIKNVNVKQHKKDQLIAKYSARAVGF